MSAAGQVLTPPGVLLQAVHEAALDQIADLIGENKMVGEAVRYFARRSEPH